MQNRKDLLFTRKDCHNVMRELHLICMIIILIAIFTKIHHAGGRTVTV